jgi:hypothetical protein
MEHHTTAESAPTREERTAQAEWLIGELRRRAAGCEDPREQANLRRCADSLVRLATALRP